MKAILCTLFVSLILFNAANAQTNPLEQKQKYNFMLRLHHSQNLQNMNQNAKLKANPYWQSVDAPHTPNSYMPQIKVPVYGAVWALIKYDSSYPEKHFLHTADNGKTWRFDTIQAPAGDDLNNVAAIDANTCYASTSDANDGKGGGVYKTTNGGATWKKLNGLTDNSFIDFVYFFDADNGLVVADNNGVDTSILQIYTTQDAGKTWQPVPQKNIPPTANAAFSLTFNSYTTFKNRIWFKAIDSQGKQYLYRSDDLGKHWQLFPFDVPEFGFDFSFEDKENGLAVGFPLDGSSDLSFEVATHDGGKTWTQVTDFTGYPFGAFITVIPGTHTYVSTLPGFLPVYGSSYSRDGGKSWTLIDTGINAYHSALAFINPLHGWSGRAEIDIPNGGAFKWKLNVSLDNSAVASNDAKTSPIINDKISATINARLYPNPAKNVLKIDGLNPSVKTTLSIYSTSGKLLQQTIATGSNYTFFLNNLSAGTYYVKIQSGDKITTLPFVKE